MEIKDDQYFIQRVERSTHYGIIIFVSDGIVIWKVRMMFTWEIEYVFISVSVDTGKRSNVPFHQQFIRHKRGYVICFVLSLSMLCYSLSLHDLEWELESQPRGIEEETGKTLWSYVAYLNICFTSWGNLARKLFHYIYF